VYKLVHKLRLPGDKIWLKLAQHWQGHTSCKQLFLISRLVDEEEIFFFFFPESGLFKELGEDSKI
jgi:hypothetical protein